MTKRNYSDETRAAVLSALLAGQSMSYVAETYKIPIGTVKGWKHREINSESPSAVVTQKRNEIGDKIVNLLSTELDILASMAITFSDPSWLKKQTAIDGYRFDAVKHFPFDVQSDVVRDAKYNLPSWASGGP